MKIIAISDTHNLHNSLVIPECDILIHAGDWSGKGRESECRNFAKWLQEQPAKHIVIVPGNHEVEFEENLPASKSWILDHCPKAIILIEESVVIEGKKIYGSPITPYFFDWAWNRSMREDGLAGDHRTGQIKNVGYIKPHWDKIPNDTDILVTHGPPFKILDLTPSGEFVGCQHLLEKVKEIKPDIHIFGHIHCSHGEKHIDGTSFYNVCSCDEMYVASQGFTEINDV